MPPSGQFCQTIQSDGSGCVFLRARCSDVRYAAFVLMVVQALLQNCFHVDLNATVIRCDDVPRRGRLCQRLSQRLFSTCSTSARSACSALSP